MSLVHLIASIGVKDDKDDEEWRGGNEGQGAGKAGKAASKGKAKKKGALKSMCHVMAT